MERPDIAVGGGAGRPEIMPTARATRTTTRALTVAGKSLASALLLAWVLSRTELGAVFDAIRAANVPLLLLASSLCFVGYVFVVARWRVLLMAQGVSAPLLVLLRSYTIAQFFNHFLPSTIGGDAVRAYDSWRLGSSKGAAVAVVFTDRLLGLVVLLLFVLGALAASGGTMAGLRLPSGWILFGSCATLALVAAIFVLPVRRGRSRRPPWAARWLWSRQLERVGGKFGDAFRAFHGRVDALAKGLAFSALLQANVVVQYYVVAQALGVSVGLAAFFVIIPLAVVVTMLPVSINGIGVRETVLVFFFGAFGVAAHTAVALAWLEYGMLLLQGMVGGLVYALRK